MREKEGERAKGPYLRTSSAPGDPRVRVFTVICQVILTDSRPTDQSQILLSDNWSDEENFTF